MSKKLDPRLGKEIMEIINNLHPELTSQEEIYRHLETTIEFTERQNKLHHQIRGQIEPNWQHDARNIMHSLKRAGKIVSPLGEHYCLPLGPPLEEICHDEMWKEILMKVENEYHYRGMIFSINNNDIIVRLKGKEKYSQTIRKNLVRERVNHLVQCGGRLRISSFHKWDILARAISILHPFLKIIELNEIEYIDIDEKYNYGKNTEIRKKIEQETSIPNSTRNPRNMSRGDSNMSVKQDNNKVSNEPQYALAALKAEHTFKDLSLLVNIVSCPPKKEGGPTVYCPICGGKFKSSRSSNGTVFFQHDGSNIGSYRKYEETWPQDEKKTWKEAANKLHGYDWRKIHRKLGYNDISDYKSSLSKAHKDYQKRQFRIPIPVYITKDLGRWKFWVVSSQDQNNDPQFKVKNIQKELGLDGKFWYKIPYLKNEYEFIYPDKSIEKISFPWETIILSDAEGTLNHERYRWPEWSSGRFFKAIDSDKNDFDEIIEEVKFKRYSRNDITTYQIALPTINGCIPWLNKNHIIPINTSNKRNELTGFMPLDSDNKSKWIMSGNIHLNANEIIREEDNRKPAIELSRISRDSSESSQKTLISLYPAHLVPSPQPSFVSIDEKRYVPGQICYVENIPDKITFISGNEESFDLVENKCTMWYKITDQDTNSKWKQKDETVENILNILHQENYQGFSISINLNSSNLYDNIIVTKKLNHNSTNLVEVEDPISCVHCGKINCQRPNMSACKRRTKRRNIKKGVAVKYGN